MFDLFKIEKNENGVFVKILAYNPNRWSNKQWYYVYATEGYPSDMGRAINFQEESYAQSWIESNMPS